ncbi:MAG TPA: hypothetical protein VGG53_03390 [Mycobacterium sp.]|uniref:hypothetical protein n=1 Tax=Mycobacterium sp. TaxID=1785 RepID=UPI002F3FC9E4
MKAKREVQPRAGDRRRRQSKASPKTGRRAAEPTPARRTGPRTGKLTAPQTSPMARPVERAARPTSATQAKARAKARKAKAPRVVRPPLRERLLNRLASIDLRPQTLAAKVPFVVLIIGSLGAGLGLTLWLSTAAAERSYQLGGARQRTELLQQQKEALERDVQEAQAAPALAEAARGLGMIPTRDTAHLIQDPAGNWLVVGTPKPAQGVSPPPLNSKLPDERPVPAPQAAPGNPVEVPTLVLPGNGAPVAPLTPGPDAMVRSPDGATTLGPQHIPVPDGPLPLPGAGPGVPGMPLVPGLPPAPVPVAPAAPVVPAPPTPAPADVAGVPHHAAPTGPLLGEQFGPLTVTTPGVPQ